MAVPEHKDGATTIQKISAALGVVILVALDSLIRCILPY
jgi:hypothetical protein